MTNPTDPAAVEAWKAAFTSYLTNGGDKLVSSPSARRQAALRVQSYGDQREAAARADERERVADLVDAADNLLKRMEASNTAPLVLLRRRLAAFRREALGEG